MHYTEESERGYTWFSFRLNHQWKLCLLVSVGILVLSFGFFVWCTRVSDDMGGDSFGGLVFAVGSTVFMFLAAVAFSLRRRARKREVGKLNGVLNWHICFALISLVMVFLHAFGNFNPRSGTYALYGMIALVISGFIGRLLDRMMPYYIARGVNRVLTTRGEDRIDSLLGKLQSKASQRQAGSEPPEQSRVARPAFPGEPASFGAQDYFAGSWDMGYVSLEKMPYEGGRRTNQYPVVAERKSVQLMASPLSSIDIRRPMDAIEEVQQVVKREAFFRFVIRLWRAFHISLALLTVGLTLWHIEYALSLIIPAVQKFGAGYLFPWP